MLAGAEERVVGGGVGYFYYGEEAHLLVVVCCDLVRYAVACCRLRGSLGKFGGGWCRVLREAQAYSSHELGCLSIS